ncbi:MAG: hypothetical protein Kow00121_52490 [Elainellaceae cyanobacterium]
MNDALPSAPSQHKSDIKRLEEELQGLKHRLAAYEARTDATQSADATESLNSQRFYHVFQQSSQFLVLLNPDGTVAEANQAILNLARVSASQVVGQAFWQTIWWSGSSATAAQIQEAVQAAAIGQFVYHEIEMQGASDYRITIDFFLKPIYGKDNQIIWLLAEGRDITKRKQAQAEIQTLNELLEQRVAKRTSQLEVSNQQKQEALIWAQQACAQAEATQVEIQLYADIVNNIPMGLTVWHLANPEDALSLTLVAANPIASDLTGLVLDEFVGTSIAACFPDVLTANRETADLFASVAITGEPQEKHEVFYQDDRLGSGFFNLTIFPLPEQCVGVAFENITNRKWAEQALRESEHRYATLTQICPVGIFRSDRDGHCLYVNDQWCEIAGSNAQQALGCGWLQSIYPDDRNQVWVEWTKLVQTHQPFRLEFRFQRPNGEITWVVGQAVVETAKNGDSISYVGTVTDISEHKKAEEALIASEQRYAALARLSPVGIFQCDMDGNYFYVNDRWCEISGLTPAEAAGQGWKQAIHPDDLERVQNVGWQSTQDNRPFQCEFRFQRPDGTVSWVFGQAALQTDLRGIPASYIGTITDITERQQAAFALQEHAAELTQLNTALTRTMNLLKERNRELDQFAYVASHDLKAPLRAIANLSEWIEDDLKGQLPEENQQQLKLLRSRVQRMESLISGLLQYSRAGRTQTTVDTVSVSKLLTEIIDSLDPPASFTIDVAPAMPTLTTRAVLLRQVFANLISNAIKHHHRPDGQIKISVQEQGKYYEFAIADDGPGIDSSNHDRVFGIFQTLTARDVKESTGIGLSIVKKIVETEDGRIRLESKLGQGSTFRFTWPKQPR